MCSTNSYLWIYMDVCTVHTVVIFPFIHLKAGFQTPEATVKERWDFRKRWSDSRKKAAPIAPRMTTPEIRALVTGFIGRDGGEAGGGKDEQ